MKILSETKFIMHKTTRTHERINVAVEFLHDIGEKRRFVGGHEPTPPAEDRENLLYLDRTTWEQMGFPKVIVVSVISRDDILNEET